jgi:uncharacterized membrane protein
MLFNKKYLLVFIPIALFSCNAIRANIGIESNDDSIYNNVATNEIVNTYKDNGIVSFWFTKKLKGKKEILDHIRLDEPLNRFELPIIRDSIDFYDFTISVNLLNEHWREHHHILITKKLIQRKRFINSWYTGH